MWNVFMICGGLERFELELEMCAGVLIGAPFASRLEMLGPLDAELLNRIRFIHSILR